MKSQVRESYGPDWRYASGRQDGYYGVSTQFDVLQTILRVWNIKTVVSLTFVHQRGFRLLWCPPSLQNRHLNRLPSLLVSRECRREVIPIGDRVQERGCQFLVVQVRRFG
jgi:hypothetical protein